MHLVTGGSASGKSACAERLAMETGTPCRYYIATMKPWGSEGRLRVERHRRMRAGKGFYTVECFSGLCELDLEQIKVSEFSGEKSGSCLKGSPKDRTVLLECLSNLMANELFDVGGSDEEILGRVEDGILDLQKQAEHFIIVTNEVFSDGEEYLPETRRYLELLGTLNQRLAARADQVTEVVFGIPIPVK